MRFYNFLVINLQIRCLFYSYHTTQFGLTTFQALHGHMWLEVTILDGTGLIWTTVKDFWLTVLFEKGRYLKVLKLGDSVRIGPACNLSPILNIRYFENTDQKSIITRAPLPTKVRLVKAIVFPIVIYWCESWTIQKAECWRIDVLSCGIGEDSWEPLGLQGDTTSQS